MPVIEEAPTIEHIYSEFVEALPPAARLQLAVLILSKIPQQAMVDYSTEWSEDDLREFSAASFSYIEPSLENENDTSG